VDLIASNGFAKMWLKNLQDFTPIKREMTDGKKYR